MNDIPVMLVHGFASSYERNWREPGWTDLLRDEDRQVIGVDLLGHGQAARPRDPAAYASLEQSVLTAMPETGQVDAAVPACERSDSRDSGVFPGFAARRSTDALGLHAVVVGQQYTHGYPSIVAV